MGLGRPVEQALPEGAEAPGQTSRPGGDIGEVRPIADEQGGTNGARRSGLADLFQQKRLTA
jgi:hypothetical protein